MHYFALARLPFWFIASDLHIKHGVVCRGDVFRGLIPEIIPRKTTVFGVRSIRPGSRGTSTVMRAREHISDASLDNDEFLTLC